MIRIVTLVVTINKQMKNLLLVFAIIFFISCTKKQTSSPNAEIITIAGNGSLGFFKGNGAAATAAMLYAPTGVAMDGADNVYIADGWNNIILKITPTGIISNFAGNDSDKGIGNGAYSGDGGAATAAMLGYPSGITVDGKGNVYIADMGNNCIRIVSPSGIIKTFVKFPISAGVASVAMDNKGNLYVAGCDNNQVYKGGTIIAGNGFGSLTATGGFSGDGGAAIDAELWYPSGVAVDGSGYVYILDYMNNRVRKVSPSGIISTFAGNGRIGYSGDGGAATNAELNYPQGIAVDNNGNVYISDGGNNRVRKVTPSGIINTIAQLNEPGALTVDGIGNVYIANGNRISKVIQ
jgi:sugar lactone lactonase YvrE